MTTLNSLFCLQKYCKHSNDAKELGDLHFVISTGLHTCNTYPCNTYTTLLSNSIFFQAKSEDAMYDMRQTKVRMNQ